MACVWLLHGACCQRDSQECVQQMPDAPPSYGVCTLCNDPAWTRPSVLSEAWLQGVACRLARQQLRYQNRAHQKKLASIAHQQRAKGAEGTRKVSSCMSGSKGLHLNVEGLGALNPEYFDCNDSTVSLYMARCWLPGTVHRSACQQPKHTKPGRISKKSLQASSTSKESRDYAFILLYPCFWGFPPVLAA